MAELTPHGDQLFASGLSHEALLKRSQIRRAAFIGAPSDIDRLDLCLPPTLHEGGLFLDQTVSIKSAASTPGRGSPLGIRFSADGRFVAFESTARNMVSVLNLRLEWQRLGHLRAGSADGHDPAGARPVTGSGNGPPPIPSSAPTGYMSPSRARPPIW